MTLPRSLALAAALAACALAPAARADAPSSPPHAGHADRIEYHDPALPPSRGPANAAVTIELFLVPGLNMPSNAMHQLQALQDRHPTRVRIIYRVTKSGTQAMVPTAALEAHAEGRFFEFLDELGRLRSSLGKDLLLEVARKAGVDPERVAQAMTSGQYNAVIEDNGRRLERLHISAPPVMLFNAHAPQLLVSSVSAADVEREYEAAYTRGLDKLDRGYPPSALLQAFYDEAMTAAPPLVLAGNLTEDEAPRAVEPPLANPPLVLDGLPAFGKPGAQVRLPIVVLCRPSDAGCSNLMRMLESEVRVYPNDIRIVWAPWFEVGRDDAAAQTLLGDAALCAETIGSNQGELTTSPGWIWLREVYAQTGSDRGRRGRLLDANKLIDTVAAKLDVDPRTLAACRARKSGATLDWVAAARRSGVHGNSAIVIGGRIYDQLAETQLIQALVESELAPGVLGSLPSWPPPAQ